QGFLQSGLTAFQGGHRRLQAPVGFLEGELLLGSGLGGLPIGLLPCRLSRHPLASSPLGRRALCCPPPVSSPVGPCLLAHHPAGQIPIPHPDLDQDRKSTRLNSSHVKISYAVFCLKKKNKKYNEP